MMGYTVAHFEADVGPVDGRGRGWGEGGHFGCFNVNSRYVVRGKDVKSR